MAVLLALCTLALALGRGEDGESLALPHGDALYYYVYAPSLWLDGDLSLDNQYAVSGDPWQHPRTPTGRAGNVFGIGAAVFESPLFLVGHGLARVTGGRADGFSMIPIALTAWASVLAAIGALWFAYRLLARRLGDERRSLAAAVLVFAGGPLLFHAIRQPHMAHPFALLFSTWLVDAWDASYDRPRTLRTWALLGALLGATVLARPQLVTWGVCLLAAALADVRRVPLARLVANLAIAGAAFLACIAPQLIAWKVNYGHFLVVPQGDGFMRWDAPAWAETLMSSRNGLLPWAPLYALGLVGLVGAARRLPRLVIVLVLGLAAQAVINGAAWDWWAGGSLGMRRYESAYVAFALGTGWLLVVTARWRIAGWLSLVVCSYLAAANVVLTLKTTPRTMRQKGGEPAAEVIASELGAFGAPAALLSSAVNLPARAAFALRHDTSLAAYDRVVGAHWLQETFPPLTTKPVRTQARRYVADIPRVFAPGFVGDALPSGIGRVLIGLNRRGTVHVTLGALAPFVGPLVVTWNGAEVAHVEVGASETVATFDVAAPSRGVNELGVRGPTGSRVLWIELRTPPGVY